MTRKSNGQKLSTALFEVLESHFPEIHDAGNDDILERMKECARELAARAVLHPSNGWNKITREERAKHNKSNPGSKISSFTSVPGKTSRAKALLERHLKAKQGEEG